MGIGRRRFLQTLGAGMASAAVFGPGCRAKKGRKVSDSGSLARPPNVVLFFTDDQGYADVGCYGAQGFQTPHLDRMAAEGVRFMDFYVAQPICGASRAALLTGCYPNRIGMMGAPDHNARHGIHEDEVTLGELFKAQGYATAIYGKWHLGHRPPFLPTRHGFDDYFGLPYSNDMWPWHPERPEDYIDLPLIEGEETIATNPDMNRLTTWYTEKAVRFIEDNKERPFFLYLPHSMAHVPLGVSDRFRGKSEQGLYGDVMMELDWSMGEILQTLKRLDLDANTLVIFTSDNGPWVSYGNHAGSADPLREAKGTTWEGGVRVPCIMRWPERIPQGSICAEPTMTIDIFPTVAELIGAELPAHPLDGRSIWPLMKGEPGAASPHESLFFYYGNNLEAVRSGRWKLHFPHKYRTLSGRQGGRDGLPVLYDQSATGWALYDLVEDVGETTNLIDSRPEVAAGLNALAEEFDKELQSQRRPRGVITDSA
jgi:arylsulfatase A-like enzyme